MTAKELERERPDYEQAYVVGPPRFFGPPLLTASVTDEVTFVLPAWFADRRIPCSAIAAQAEGAVRIEARIHTVGDTSISEPNASIEAENEDMYLLQPVWNTQKCPWLWNSGKV